MKKLMMVLMAYLVAASASAETITITSGEWTPHTGKTLKRNGFVLNVISEVLKQAGYDVQYKFYPWARAYNKVKEGEVDASAFWYESKERAQHCYYSKALLTEQLVFFHRKDKPLRWNTFDDLKGFKIGASIGMTYTEQFWAIKDTVSPSMFQTAGTDLQNFKKLLKKRIDVFPIPIMVGSYIIKEHLSDRSTEISFNPKPLKQATGHLLFAKTPKGKKYLEVFDNGLELLKASGGYEKIYKEHFGISLNNI